MPAEATLVEAMGLVRQEHRVDGWLSVTWEPQVEQTTHYVGRGRGAVHCEKRVIPPTRSHITAITRQGDTSAARSPRGGWQACVTTARHTRRSVQEAVVCSRHASRVARRGNRLTSRVQIAPLCVKRHAPMEGLTSLLTLGVRVLTVTAFVLRRSLAHAQVRRRGFHPENTHKRTDTPTAERIPKACADRSLTSIKHAAGADILRRLTPLSG